MTYYLKAYPEENIKVFADNFIMQPGGPALNAAITFTLLGEKAVIASSFGSSEIANSMKEMCRNENLSIVDLKEGEEYNFPISTIMVSTVSGTRTITNAPKGKIKAGGSKAELLKGYMPGIVLIDGYDLEDRYDIIKYWKENGVVIVLDGGSWKDNTYEYLHYVDIAICSDRFRLPDKEMDGTIKGLHEMGVKYVAFTREENDIVISTNGERKNIPVPKVKAIDTLGAGDVFHGSFCCHYLQSNDFETALRLASCDASRSCEYFGTHGWVKE